MAWSYGFTDIPELSPWPAFRMLQDEMNRILEGSVPRSARANYPAINVWSNDDKAIAVAALPGLDPNAVEVTVSANMLTITGERIADLRGEGTRVHRRERPSGKFSRTVELPFPVDSAAVEAEYKNGMLRVTLPRAQAHKPRRIPVN